MSSDHFLQQLNSQKISKYSCPECSSGMSVFKADSVLIDKCNSCHGIWLDHKEFPIFKRTLDSYDLKKIKEFYHSPDNSVNSYVIHECPKCVTPLVDAKYSYKSGVEFKKCVRCLGLWLSLQNTLNLISLSKVGQEIEAPLKMIVDELQEMEKRRQMYAKVESVGKVLKMRIWWVFFRFWRGFFRFF